jgi:hypothetical protein
MSLRTTNEELSPRFRLATRRLRTPVRALTLDYIDVDDDGVTGENWHSLAQAGNFFLSSVSMIFICVAPERYGPWPRAQRERHCCARYLCASMLPLFASFVRRFHELA